MNHQIFLCSWSSLRLIEFIFLILCYIRCDIPSFLLRMSFMCWLFSSSIFNLTLFHKPALDWCRENKHHFLGLYVDSSQRVGLSSPEDHAKLMLDISPCLPFTSKINNVSKSFMVVIMFVGTIEVIRHYNTLDKLTLESQSEEELKEGIEHDNGREGRHGMDIEIKAEAYENETETRDIPVSTKHTNIAPTRLNNIWKLMKTSGANHFWKKTKIESDARPEVSGG